jgi:hypothetical protein
MNTIDHDDPTRLLAAAAARYEAALERCLATPADHPDYSATVIVRDACERSLIRLLDRGRTVHPHGRSIYWVSGGELHRRRRPAHYRIHEKDARNPQ